MTERIKAIETKYKGYRFRSRLEARWAVFLDAIGWEWLYEPEGFDLGEAGWYLPDFCLPESGNYLEIKPAMPTIGELYKMWSLARVKNSDSNQKHMTPHYVVCGTPGKPKICLGPEKDGIADLSVKDGYAILSTSGIWLNQEQMPMIEVCCFAMASGGKVFDIKPLYCDIDHIKPNSIITPLDVPHGPAETFHLLLSGTCAGIYIGSGIRYWNNGIRKAYDTARSARFEHGEKGAAV